MLTKLIGHVKMRVMERFFKQCPEIETLRAIEEVRAELTELTRRGYDEIGFVEYTERLNEVRSRLMTLYGALNVHNVIVAIEHIDFKSDSENDAA